jgi:hypothetical protein
MNGRKAVVGLCMLCALVFSAFAAQSASAVTKGTTAYTCVKGAGNFLTEHCVVGETGGTYGHVEIPKDTTTEITGSNSKSNGTTTGPESARLKETIGGVETELVSEEVSGSGWMTNAQAANGEHFAHGEGTITYSKVKVTKPAGKGCEVFADNGGTKGEKEMVTTNALKATTKEQEMFVKFEPAAGAVFATFFIECTTKVAALEGTWEITGSLKCPTNGATIKCDHNEITTQNTLKGKGNKAGLAGPLTLIGKDGPKGDVTYNPLSVTTVETP